MTVPSPDQDDARPRNSDAGGHHLAFYVADMPAAVDHLRRHGVKILGDPTTVADGASAGLTWVYFLAPWGLQMEIISYPQGMAYEKSSPVVLWSPKDPAK